MSRKRRNPRSSAGMGFGIAGVGCVLLGGFLGLSGVILCGGVGSSVWSRMPRVVEVSPPRPVSGTDPSPPEPEPVARPRPRPRPRPKPAGTAQTPESPDEPTIVAVEDEERIVASITVAGDAEQVVAVDGEGTAFPLPATLPRGTYDLQVAFAGSEPFGVGSLAVLDGTPQTVTCKQSLGLCRIR